MALASCGAQPGLSHAVREVLIAALGTACALSVSLRSIGDNKNKGKRYKKTPLIYFLLMYQKQFLMCHYITEVTLSNFEVADVIVAPTSMSK